MYNTKLYNTGLYNHDTPATQLTPERILRIAFASDAYTSSPSWEIANSELRSFSVRRGRQHELNRMEAGTLTCLLVNTDRRYWPGETGSPHYPNVKPGVRINLRAMFQTEVYDLFTGYIERWTPSFILQGLKGNMMTVEAADAIKNLAVVELNDGTGYAIMISGTRIHAVLNDINWLLADRDIDTGQTTLQATGALSNVKAMDHLFTVQDSEGGIIFITGGGVLTFHDRHARFKAPLLTSQATFSDVSGQKYADIIFSYDDQYIYNDVRRTRTGGTEQTASDAASQGDFGKRTNSKQGLLMSNDNEALAQAGYLKNKYKNPAMRIRAIKIYPQADPGNLFPKVLSYDIGTKITVQLDESSISEDYHIEGIEHSWDKTSNKWVTTWQLTKSEALFWILGQAGFSELGQTTYLGY